MADQDWGLAYTVQLGRCGSCVHWDTDVPGSHDADDQDVGVCKAAYEDHVSGDPPEFPRLIAASCCDAAWVLTRASFGCVLWEPDPATLRSLA